MNFIFDPVFLAIIIFGSATSYIDIKYGKIKNISVILLLVAGVVVNIFFTKTLSIPSLDIGSDFIQTISNVVIAVVLGFSLWLAGLLSEGDAKLFVGFSMLLPVFLYKQGYLFLFPGVVILINTVIPVAIFLVIRGMTRIRRNQLKVIKYIFSFKNFLTNILFLFGFSFLLQSIFDYFAWGANFFFQAFILFALMEIFNKFFEKNILPISIMVSLVAVIFFYYSVISVQFITQFLILAVLFQVVVTIFYVVDFSFGKEVKISQLKSGMLIGDKLIKVKGNYVKYYSSFVNLFDLIKSVGDYYSQNIIHRLSAEDVKSLQKLHSQKKLKFDTIKVVEAMPFAPFMFLGVFLTYFLQGSLFGLSVFV